MECSKCLFKMERGENSKHVCLKDLKATLKKEKMELDLQKRKLGIHMENSEWGVVKYYGASAEMEC